MGSGRLRSSKKPGALPENDPFVSPETALRFFCAFFAAGSLRVPHKRRQAFPPFSLAQSGKGAHQKFLLRSYFS